MQCLYCGDCCMRFNPFYEGACDYLIQEGNFFFCSVYVNRPKECHVHGYDFKYCPIGIDKLQLNSFTEISLRIDEGWKKIKELNKKKEKI